MPRSQRIAMLAIAALIAVVAVVVLRPAGDDETTPNAQQTSATSAPTTTPAPSDGAPAASDADSAPAATPQPRRKAPKPPLLIADSGRTLTFQKGDRVAFRVRHGSAEEVHVHGYDIMRELQAGETVTIRFPAGIEGIFEVELEQSGTPLGSLKVEP
jgi:hypothetical protein